VSIAETFPSRNDMTVAKCSLSVSLRVLRRKFHWQDGEIRSAREEIYSMTRLILPTRTLNVISEDEPDNRILECAAKHVSDFIVSHDNNFLRRRTLEGIPIVKAGPFLERGVGIKSNRPEA
jgi:predicted nucleic acid-binding protein